MGSDRKGVVGYIRVFSLVAFALSIEIASLAESKIR